MSNTKYAIKLKRLEETFYVQHRTITILTMHNKKYYNMPEERRKNMPT